MDWIWFFVILIVTPFLVLLLAPLWFPPVITVLMWINYKITEMRYGPEFLENGQPNPKWFRD